MIYAILKKDGSGIVKGVSDLAGEVSDPLMIEIPSYDQTLIGKRYANGEFVASGIVSPTPPVDPITVILEKLDKMEKDIADIKLKQK